MACERVHAHFEVGHRELACGWRLVHLVEGRGHGDGKDEAHDTRREKGRDVADAGGDGVHCVATTRAGRATRRRCWTLATRTWPSGDACRALPRARC